MHSLRFPSLVLAVVVSWAAVAGWLALSSARDPASPGVRSIAAAFPTAEAGFASRPVDAGH